MSSIIDSQITSSNAVNSVNHEEKFSIKTTLRDLATLASMFVVTATITLLSTLSWIS